MNGYYIISMVTADKEIQEKLAAKFESELESLPEGKLYFKILNGKSYYYHYTKSDNEDSRQRYLSKKEDKLIAALKRKYFIEKSLPLLYKNIKAAETFLHKYQPFVPSDIIANSQDAYKDMPYSCYQDYIMSPDLTAWSKEEYKKCELYPDVLIHVTINGLKVRSKSEAIIAGLLEMNNIPFRYEAALELGERTYYPDFTILKPRDNEIIYWEHFGMIDNDEYNLSMEQKMLAYGKHGILPWNQLITTFETEKGSINARNIQNIIKAFIL